MSLEVDPKPNEADVLRMMRSLMNCNTAVLCSLCAALLSPLKRELLLRVRSDIETVTDSWLSTAIKSLLLIQSRSGS